MFEDLEVAEAQAVAPRKMDRAKPELPAPISGAWDNTPIGDARELVVKLPISGDRVKVGNALCRLIKERAASQFLVAFKLAYRLTDEGLTLYWHKKPGRGKPEPSILPMPSEKK